MHLLRTVVQAVTPTSVFPAPHGNTITPKQILAFKPVTQIPCRINDEERQAKTRLNLLT